MASVPNMRLGPPLGQGSAAPAMPEEAGDLFAQLVTMLPGTDTAAAALDSGAVTPAALPAELPAEALAESEQDPAQSPEALLALVAQVHAAQPRPEAAPAPPASPEAAPAAGPVAIPKAPDPAAALDAQPLDPESLPTNPAPVAAGQRPQASVPVPGQILKAPSGEPAATQPVASSAKHFAPAPPAPQPDMSPPPPTPEDHIALTLRRIVAAAAAPAQARTPSTASEPRLEPAPVTRDAPLLTPAGLQVQPAHAPLAPQPLTANMAGPLQPQPQSQAAEPLLDLQIDAAADGEWLDQLARDIARSGGSEGPLRFRLNPEHLGRLQVELEQQADGTSVHLRVESEAARAIVAEAQPRLLAEARAQGLRISDTHVDLAGGNGSGDARPGQGERRDPLLRTASSSSTASAEAQPMRGDANSDRYA